MFSSENMAAPESAQSARDFTNNEWQAIQAAQAELRRKREALRTEEAQEFRRALNANHQPKLFSLKATLGPIEEPVATSQPEETPQGSLEVKERETKQKWPAAVTEAVEEAMNHVVRPRTPEWYAEQTLEAAREVMIEQLLVQGKTKRKTIRKDRLERNLKVYKLLAHAAYERLEQLHARLDLATNMMYFTVLDLLPALSGMGHSACEQALADLRACKLIATRRDYQQASFNAEALDKETGELKSKKVMMNAITGCWVNVALKPGSVRAKIYTCELEANPRDLAEDRKVGRTAYQLAKELKAGESSPYKGSSEKISCILIWTLPLEEFNQSSSVVIDSLPFLNTIWNPLEDIRAAVDAAKNEHPQRRKETIERAAQTIGKWLNDQHTWSIKGYCRMLWRGIQAELKDMPALEKLLAAIERTLIFQRETEGDPKPLRRPGAYLRSLLTQTGWMDAVYH